MESPIIYDNLKESTKIELKELVFLAISSGKIMLSSGAETYRVEDTIERICRSHRYIDNADCFVVPTGIFLSIRYKEDSIFYFRRIRTISNNLNRVHLINQLSRDFIDDKIDISDGFDRLETIIDSNLYNVWVSNFFVSISAGGFTALFGNSFIDVIISFIVSLITLNTIHIISKLNFIVFIEFFIGGVLISGLSFIADNFGLASDVDNIIISTLMPLLPGYAFTNAIRDILSRDYISGLSRMIEAVLIAVSLAIGVGAVLTFM